MPCYHPLQAWRTDAGDVILGKARHDGKILQLPCGNCIGCRQTRAQAWALRCQLELQDHNAAVFATLTYDQEHIPLTLSKPHITAYLKRLRKLIPQKLRFFASGEYGETTQRPHYHAILYGVSQLQAPQLEKAWTKGHVRIDQATPANIAYTAGYCSKKIGYRRHTHQRIDPLTGQLYEWQPPFIQMSRNPGIGHKAKQYLNSWRLYAIKDGHKMPVPPYFKKHWKLHATMEDLDSLKDEILRLNLNAPTPDQLRAAEEIAAARQRIAGDKRKL